MSAQGRHATWLEAVSVGRAQGPAVTLHRPRRPQGECAGIAMSIDGRPLVASNGERTLFCSIGAAERFLSIAGIADYRCVDEDAVNAVGDHALAHCVAVTRGVLCNCPVCKRRRRPLAKAA